MKIAIMSDSHDNIWNIRKALSLCIKNGIEMIIHCGDFVAPFSLEEFQTAGIPFHGVFGNNDGETFLITQRAETIWHNITIYGMVGSVSVDGVNIGFAHEYVIARGLASTGKYDLVCFGHSHSHDREDMNETILLNPGEIMGKDGNPGFCIFDSSTGDIRRIDID